MGWKAPQFGWLDADPELSEAQEAVRSAEHLVFWRFGLSGRGELRAARERLREVELARELGVQSRFVREKVEPGKFYARRTR